MDPVLSIALNRRADRARFVCALSTADDRTIRFRNYERGNNPSDSTFTNCTIWEAARATSAAPFYFPTARVNGVKFWDGGLENNNPVDEVWAEKGRERAACVVSLGTGISLQKKARSWLPALGKGKKILGNVTKTEGRHRNFQEKMENEGVPYFRFNPPTAEDNIGLADYKKLPLLERHTRAYLAREDTKAELRRCAEILVAESSHHLLNGYGG